MPNRVVHFEVLGRNGKALQDFYSTLFQWNLELSHPADYGEVDTQAGGISGGIGQNDQSRVTFYVEVEDLQASLDGAVKLGGKVILPPTEIPGDVTLAKFADPEGNIIGLLKR